MRRLLCSGVLCVFAIVTNCSAPTMEEAPPVYAPPPPPPPPPPAPVEMPEDFPSESVTSEYSLESAATLEVVTDFLRVDQAFLPALGEIPVGLVLFDQSEQLKNAVLCDAYTKELRTHSEAKAASPDQEFFVTYWLLKEEAADYSSCDALRQSYDYERAAAIKAEYGLSESKGPIFLAVDGDGNSVFLDLSESSLEATRSAVDEWLTLALENSAAGAPEEVAATETLAINSRFSLASFSEGIKNRLMSPSNASPFEVKREGKSTLYAYTDTSTGYRIGSTLKF